MDSLQAHLLVASPQLLDPNFRQTVVLLAAHDPQGAFGWILNRPSGKSVAEVWELLDCEQPCDNLQPVYSGGPVPGPLMALHQEEELGEMELLPGVFVSGAPDAVAEIILAGGLFQLFSNYSGWGTGQLEQELAGGGWLTTPALHEHLFSDRNDFWKWVVEQVGRRLADDFLQGAPQPPEAWMN